MRGDFPMTREAAVFAAPTPQLASPTLHRFYFPFLSLPSCEKRVIYGRSYMYFPQAFICRPHDSGTA
jgi:hypothetical protein